MLPKIRVLIVDDSAIVREILSQRLGRDGRIEVVGTAMDPYVARDKLEKLEVDVITLDIEMPRMDGLSFLRELMRQYPIPVVVLSSLTQGSNDAAMRALELGAVEVVPKPGGPFSVEEVIPLLIDKIIAATRVNMTRLREEAERRSQKAPLKKPQMLSTIRTTQQIIAIGASTGGTIAMEKLFMDWEPSFPPTLAVIHMPERFTASFAGRLNDVCPVEVCEAKQGEHLRAGVIYIAPGNFHMLLRTQGTERRIKIASGPKVCNQRPAVDPLFDSVAQQAGRNCIALLLTGMGRDGAAGLLKIREAGGYTIAQDEKSSIVWGMPKEAIDLGAAEVVLGLDAMATHIKKRLA